jgi:hypothetical protein
VKKILTYSLIIVFILSLAIPGKGVLFNINKTSANTSLTSNFKSSQVLVKIVSLPTLPTVTVSQAQAKINSAQACSTNFSNGSNIVQDAGILNLNSPADCFNLSIVNKVPEYNQTLSVQALLSASYKVFVLQNKTQIQDSLHNSTPTAQQNPILPVAQLIIFTALFFSKKRLIARALRVSVAVKQHLSVFELQILRC